MHVTSCRHANLRPVSNKRWVVKSAARDSHGVKRKIPIGLRVKNFETRQSINDDGSAPSRSSTCSNSPLSGISWPQLSTPLHTYQPPRKRIKCISRHMISCKENAIVLPAETSARQVSLPAFLPLFYAVITRRPEESHSLSCAVLTHEKSLQYV